MFLNVHFVSLTIPRGTMILPDLSPTLRVCRDDDTWLYPAVGAGLGVSCMVC